MPIINFPGVICSSAIARPATNKETGRQAFFALIAYPPEVRPLLSSLLAEAGASGRKLSARMNADREKPIEGIPDDWIVLRANTGADFPPAVYGKAGVIRDQRAIREATAPGAEAYLECSLYLWEYKGRPGCSLNLVGLGMTGNRRESVKGPGGSNASAMAAVMGGFSRPANPAQQAAARTPAPAAPADFGEFDDDVPF